MRTVRYLAGGRRGYSALELVIVILIMGILTTIAMPYLVTTLRQSALEGSADDLISAFSSARSLALGGNTFTRITLNEAGNRLDVYKYSPDTNTWDDTNEGMTLIQGISFTSGGITFDSSQVTFDPHGSLMSGGTITIQDTRGNTITLTTLLATGRLMRS
jgi:prepilin-type N-terminal cleavage/methylation domain-containing protein